MKHLYIISIELDETSEYFTEMTEAQARAMRKALEKTKDKFSIDKIREAPGYNTYKDLMATFKDMAQE